MTHDEMIAVIQAHKDGKTIQWKSRNDSRDKWDDCPLQPSEWDWSTFDFRIKPEPFEAWFNVYRGERFSQPHSTPESANCASVGDGSFIRTIHLREVPKP